MDVVATIIPSSKFIVQIKPGITMLMVMGLFVCSGTLLVTTEFLVNCEKPSNVIHQQLLTATA